MNLLQNSKNCRVCKQSFSVFPEDRKFYQKMKVPEPTLCPDCRQKRRAAFRNERKLYRRKCDFSGKNIISVYSEDLTYGGRSKPYKVYDQEIWWSDAWDAKDYGRDFDFSKPFFSQFRELMLAVPRISLFTLSCENSPFCNHAPYNKNCYMCFNVGYSQDAFYSDGCTTNAKDCCDCTSVIDAELLYECTDCKKCYNSSFLTLCENCSDSDFLYDCRGCRDCFMCGNLRNKTCCIENVQYSKEEYWQKVVELKKVGRTGLLDRFKKFLVNDVVYCHMQSNACENVSGNFIFSSKDVFDSFDVSDCQDLRYCFDALDIKDCMDTYQTMDKCELQYETHACSESYDAAFCNISHRNKMIRYTDLCFDCQNLFGCVGLKRANYCILNKQHSREEYEKMVPQIIEHMKLSGEWGEFFPAELSPFKYEETMAADYF